MSDITGDLTGYIDGLADKAQKAVRLLGTSSGEARDRALRAAAATIRRNSSSILTANQKDVEAALKRGISAAFIDRLTLDESRLEAMAAGLEAIADLPDPLQVRLDEWEVPNGLKIARISTSLGVIGIIYESRPNVTVDAGGLCIKSGNAAILRGGI